MAGLKRPTLILSSAALLAQMILFLATPALTARYSPSDFGELGVFNSTSNLLVGIACLRYEQAIPLAGDERQLGAVIRICIFSLLAWTGLTQLLGLLQLLGSIQEFLLPAAVLVGGLGMVLELVCVRRGNFRVLGSARVLQVLVTLCVQLYHPRGGAFDLVLGQVLGSAVSGAWIQLSLGGMPGSPERDGLAQAAKRFRRFPLFGIWSSLAVAGAFQVPTLLLHDYYGNQVAGWYSLSQRMVSVPSLLLADSLARVFLGRGAQLWRRDIDQLRQLFLKVLGFQCLGAAMLAAGVWSLAPTFFVHWLGTKWFQAGLYSQLLVLGGCLSFMSTPFESLVDISERQNLGAIRDVLRLFLLTAPLPLGHHQGWTASQTILALSCGLALYSMLSLALSAYCLFARPSVNPVLSRSDQSG